MRIVIIEDEHLAAKRLKDLILKYIPNADIIENLVSVKKSVEWFRSNSHPQLLFCDIQLADGLCFEFFELVQVNCPVIFTTAYDEYALKAFKVNSIDYLLKPIDYEELKQALAKFEKLYPTKDTVPVLPSFSIEDLIETFGKQHKNRFVIKVGLHLKPIETSEIQYFFSLEKSSFLCTSENKNYDLDYSLDQIEKLTNPKYFFRINRKYIVNINFIREITAYSNSRLKVEFKNSEVDDAIVARERVADFRNWLG